MPNGHGETTADYAWDAARTNADSTTRLAELLVKKGVLTLAEFNAWKGDN